MNKQTEIEVNEITLEDIFSPVVEKNATEYLPKHLQEAASKLPAGKEYTVLELTEEGAGHNASLLTVASTCFKMGVSYEDTLEHLQNQYHVDRIDHEVAPQRAVDRVWQVDGDLSQIIDQEKEDTLDAKEEMLMRFRRTTNSQVRELSPEPVATKTKDIIEGLFAPEDIINIQEQALHFGTLCKVKDIEQHTPLENWFFLNPATFKKVEGVPNPLNADKISTRCNANVKERRYMVLEFDYPEGDTQGQKNSERFNTFALTMAEFAPLVMVVNTGGKSVHYWYDTAEVKKTIKDRFFSLACLHGADPRLGVKSQIARMPNTPPSKEGRGMQTVVYLDIAGANHPKEWDLAGFEKCLKQSKHLQFYYDASKSRPYISRSDDDPERWVARNKDSLKDYLGNHGMRLNAEKDLGEIISPASQFICEVEATKSIEATLKGAAGYHSGFYEIGTTRVVVLKSPNLIVPKKGQFATVEKLLKGMFGHDEDQLNVVLGWLAARVKAAYNDGKRVADINAPAQMLHILGEPNSGKTFLLKFIIAPLLGGGIAKADPLFKRNSSEQNAEMFAAPLLALDDSSVIESNYEYKKFYSETVKEITVGQNDGYRAMHQDRIADIRPFRSVIRCMNLEPQTVSTIPALEEGFADKIILLHAKDMKKGPLGGEMIGRGWQDIFQARIKQELSAFAHYLLNEYKLPNSLSDTQGRFAVQSYKSPVILEMMNEGSPEQYLATRIDTDCQEVLFGGMFEDGEKATVWEGTLDQLYDTIAEVGGRTQQYRFQKVCPNSRIMLSQLRSLEKKYPHRIIYSGRQEEVPKKKKGVYYWIIRSQEHKAVEKLEQEIDEML